MAAVEAPKQRHLLHVFSTFGVGGPQVRFATVANRLGRKYRHSIIAMDGNYSCAERLDPDLDVALCPLPVEKGPGLSLANLRSFRAELERLRPDLLLTSNWGSVEWALANRLRPLCRNLHFEDGFGPDEADGRQLARRVWFRRLALSGQSEIVVPSRHLQRIATERWGFSAKRVHYVPNGVDCDRFARAPDSSQLGPSLPPPGALLVGSVGGLRPEKNFARLVRAMANLPPDLNAYLVLVGDGPERPALEEQVRSRRLERRVVFTGSLPNPETVLGLFAVFALSSDTEQMPIVLLEAMAAALPVVATDVGDVREMLSEENRPLVAAPGDEAAFTAALAALLRDPKLRRRLGQANRTRACDEFDETRMIETYDRLFAG